jgi:hypothetical protein
LPSSGVDLMNLPNPLHGQPVQGVGQGGNRKNTLVTLKIKENNFFINLFVFNKISHPPLTMVAKMASIVFGGSQ